MTTPDFRNIYSDPLDAECCEGYYDGQRPASPVPGPNRHPAYIHGFLNGRDDLRGRPRMTTAEIRANWQFIVAMCGGGE